MSGIWVRSSTSEVRDCEEPRDDEEDDCPEAELEVQGTSGLLKLWVWEGWKKFYFYNKKN